MVHRKTNKVAPIKKKKSLYYILVPVLFFVTLFSVLLVLVCFRPDKSDTEEIQPETTQETEATEPEEEVVVLPARIDFQPVIDQWVQNTAGEQSVFIVDLDRDEIVGSYRPDASYFTASLYKLFVVYEGYRKINSSEWNGSDPVGRTGYSILKCLDLAIRESHSPCAETLWSMIGRDALEATLGGYFAVQNSSVSGFKTTARDMATVMRLFYNHPDITDPKLVDQMIDSFLNQPPTTYVWRQGLPSGFSDRVLVYDKVGWDYNSSAKLWSSYHDAAIVEFPEHDRRFIVIAMTKWIPSSQALVQLGKAIEAHFYNNI